MESQNRPPFAKFRFEWKKEVNADPTVSRGAKHFATCLCDNYVNKHTGCCWPKNKTIAKKLSVQVRTVQRYYRELERKGYLCPVCQDGARRAHKICLPRREDTNKGDSGYDIPSPSNMTCRAPEGDTVVTPYKNQGNNQGKRRSHMPSVLRCIRVSDNEHQALNEWRSWITENTEFDACQLLNLVRRREAYLLPGRYPQSNERANCMKFFESVIDSEGRCLP